MKGRVLVAGFATRHVAQSARNAGYEVCAVDHFCDQDLAWYTKDREKFDELEDLPDAIDRISRRHSFDLFIPTSGAEDLPTTLPLCGTPRDRIQRFLDNATLARALPCMTRCAVWFADDQIRAQATIGGNIVNASPAADATPCLIAHNATVELVCARGKRTMPLHDFVTGPNKTALADGELLVAFECDALPGHGGSFEKVGHRRSLVISLVCLAALLKLDAQGRRIEDARLAIAGIGPRPVRLGDVEKFLLGGPVSAERLEQAADMPVGLVASRTRQDYRREVVRGFMLRGLINAAKRAGCDSSALTGELEAAYV